MADEKDGRPVWADGTPQDTPFRDTAGKELDLVRAKADTVYFEANQKTISRQMQFTAEKLAAEQEVERLERVNAETRAAFEAAEEQRQAVDKKRLQDLGAALLKQRETVTGRLASNVKRW